MNVLGAANKTDRSHPKAVGLQCRLCGSDQCRVISRAEVIVAHIFNTASARDLMCASCGEVMMRSVCKARDLISARVVANATQIPRASSK
jgi:hypothetical protein